MQRTRVKAVIGVVGVLAVVAAVAVGPRARATPAEGEHAEGQVACTPLSDSQLVAQLVGAPVRSTVVTPQLRTMVAHHAGTGVLFGAAIETRAQVTQLIDGLDAAAPDGLTPMIAVDEEGGRVARFGEAGVTVHLPSARQQAATQTTDQVRDAAAGLAGQLAPLGVDLNLAPVADLSAAPARTIVGDRSFSADPAVAGAYVAAFAAGMADGGIATTAKHLPDHGLTTVDTHTSRAVVDVSRQAMRSVHLAPYRQALDHLDAVMASHLVVPSLDPDLPVGLSAEAIAFFRTALGDDGGAGRSGFDGVVMTDDLSMQAVATLTDQASAAVMAIAAGVDLVLVGSTEAAGPVHAHLLASLADGTLSRHRVVEAARRVLTLKLDDPSRVHCLIGPTHYARLDP